MSRSKLVRDKIPQIIRARGEDPVVRVAEVGEFRGLLRDKLLEEVDEFLSSEDPTELADVFEVLLALAADLGIDRDGLEKLRAQKELERGRFASRIVWSDTAAVAAPGVR